MPFDALAGDIRRRAAAEAPLGWRYSSRLKRLLALIRPRHPVVEDVARLLTAALARIQQPENWCQGHYTDGSAVCLLTALRQEAVGFDASVGRYAAAVLQDAASNWGLTTIEELNDRLDHAGLVVEVSNVISGLQRDALLNGMHPCG